MTAKKFVEEWLGKAITEDYFHITEAYEMAKVPVTDIKAQIKIEYDAIQNRQHKYSSKKMREKAWKWFMAHPKYDKYAVGSCHYIYPDYGYKQKQRCVIERRFKSKFGKEPWGEVDIQFTGRKKTQRMSFTKFKRLMETNVSRIEWGF